MSRKSIMMSIATAAVLGAALFAPTSASAFGGYHGMGGVHGGAMHAGLGFRQGHPKPCIRCWHPHWPGYVHHYRRPIWYGAVPVTYAAAPSVNPGPCTCLSKEYTPEGAVLFKDRCTNEMAQNPPGAEPQQTGMVQPR